MTVGELLTALQQYPSDLEVKIEDAEIGPCDPVRVRLLTVDEQLRIDKHKRVRLPKVYKAQVVIE